jgi:uncharacterized membrane protein
MRTVTFVGTGLAAMVLMPLLMLVLGLVFFMATSWIVAFGTNVATGSRPSADFTAIAAALLTLGGLLGGRARHN